MKLDSLQHVILYVLTQDWLDLCTVDAYAAELEPDPGPRRNVVLQAIRSLAREGLVRLGHVDRLSRDQQLRLGFAEWSEPTDNQLDRVAKLYQPGDRDAPVWPPAVRLDVTARGRELAETLPWPSRRFFEWANPLWLEDGRPVGASVQQIACWILEEPEELAQLVSAYGAELVDCALALIDSTDAERMSREERLCRASLQMRLRTRLPDGTPRGRILGSSSVEERRRELVAVAHSRAAVVILRQPPRGVPWSLRDGAALGATRQRSLLHRGRAARERPPAEVEHSSLAHLVLYLGDDDWVPIGEVDSYAKVFEREPAARARLCLGTIQSLAEAGYIEIGHVGRHNPKRPRTTDFMEWPGVLSDRMARLAEVYQPDAADEKSWYWACLLRLTDVGERVLATLAEPDGHFFDEEM